MVEGGPLSSQPAVSLLSALLQPFTLFANTCDIHCFGQAAFPARRLKIALWDFWPPIYHIVGITSIALLNSICHEFVTLTWGILDVQAGLSAI